MSIERRRHPRVDALKSGTLFFAEGIQCLDCLVWNVSTSGALVEVETTAEVPALGRLSSEWLFLDRAYSLVWRDGRKIGIEFAA